MIIQAHHKSINVLAKEVDSLSESHTNLAEDHNDLVERYNELLNLVKELVKQSSTFADNHRRMLLLNMDKEQRMNKIENFLADSYNYDISDKEERFQSLLKEHGIKMMGGHEGE